MRDSRGLLILLVVVVAAAAVVWWLTGPRDEGSTVTPDESGPVRFQFPEVAVRSPELAVGPADVRGAISPDHTSWLVITSCLEPAGCAGELALEIRYDTGVGSRVLRLVTRCDAPQGGELRFEGLQDPSTPVRRIERLTLEVTERGAPDGSGDEVEL